VEGSFSINIATIVTEKSRGSPETDWSAGGDENLTRLAPQEGSRSTCGSEPKPQLGIMKMCILTLHHAVPCEVIGNQSGFKRLPIKIPVNCHMIHSVLTSLMSLKPKIQTPDCDEYRDFYSLIENAKENSDGGILNIQLIEDALVCSTPCLCQTITDIRLQGSICYMG
jgi:hypothetical protein